MNMDNQRSLLLFVSSLNSEETKKRFLFYLEKFLMHFKLKDYDSIIKLDRKRLTTMLEDYVLYLRDKVSPNTIPTQMTAIKSFLEINDITINWKLIRRLFPEKIKLTGMQPWTTDHIRQMLEVAPDIRAKALIHFLASTGARIGAIDDLKLKHIGDMPLYCKSVLIYEGSTAEYYAFLTPEASKVLEQYFNKRKVDGEVLTNEGPVFRTAYQFGSEKTTPLKKPSAEGLTHRIIRKAGLREPKEGKRYNIQQNHGFRKRFNTILKRNNAINSNITEKLMNHKNGLDGVYLTPTKEELFEEFQKAIPELTIDDSERIRTEKKNLEQKQTEVEKQRIENEKMLQRIEKLECGPEARDNTLYKNMLQVQGDKGTELIQLMVYLMFEMSAAEDEKREIWKKINQSRKNGQKFDLVGFLDNKKPSLKNWFSTSIAQS